MLRVLMCIAFIGLQVVSMQNVAAENCRHVGEVNDVSSDRRIAFLHVQAAAVEGDTACQRLLASMHGFGTGTPSDEVAARRWKMVAALSGDVTGRKELVSIFGSRDNAYDPILVYALLSEAGEQNDAVLEYWAARISALDLIEAKRVSTALSHLRKNR